MIYVLFDNLAIIKQDNIKHMIIICPKNPAGIKNIKTDKIKTINLNVGFIFLKIEVLFNDVFEIDNIINLPLSLVLKCKLPIPQLF